MSKNNSASNKALKRGNLQTAVPSNETTPTLSRPSYTPQQSEQSVGPSESQEKSEQQPPELPKVIKQLQAIPSATNAAGESFSAGDKILVSAPWEGKVAAEIVSFYQDNSGNAWAKYIPTESRPGWSWERGFIRAGLLMRAQA